MDDGLPEVTPEPAEPPATLPVATSGTATTASIIADKLDALLLANGIDPQIIEEGGIEAVKRAVGRSS